MFFHLSFACGLWRRYYIIMANVGISDSQSQEVVSFSTLNIKLNVLSSITRIKLNCC